MICLAMTFQKKQKELWEIISIAKKLHHFEVTIKPPRLLCRKVAAKRVEDGAEQQSDQCKSLLVIWTWRSRRRRIHGERGAGNPFL
jgi:hypothetical protein